MKYIYLFVIAIAFSACRSSNSDIAFSGSAKGLSSGTIIIKDQTTNDPVFTANVEGGKFSINKQRLQQKGFYDLVILAGVKPHKFEIYLEPGVYTINIDKDKIDDYPDITTAQPGLQTDITTYTRMAESATAPLRKEVKELNAQLRTTTEGQVNYEDITKRLRALVNEIEEANVKALEAFVDKYPTNVAAAHITAKMNYVDEPERFLRIYNKFSAADKQSDEGKAIGEKLNGMLNLAKKDKAEPLEGTTPDGKSIDFKKLGAKLILVEFWRSDSELSRGQHQAIVLNPLPGYKEKELAIVSVSLDTKRERWLEAIKADKVDWLQVSDLKGNSSPNAYKWGITTLPSFYLIDPDGKFIQRDLPFKNLGISISSFLEKH